MEISCDFSLVIMPGNDRNAVMPQLTADVQHDLFVIDYPFSVVLTPIIGRYKLPFFNTSPVWIFEIASVWFPFCS